MARPPNDPRGSTARSLACLLAMMLPAAAGAEGAVWVVDNGESSLYLAGTIHKLSPQQYPLPREYQAAYDRAGVTVFETDIDAMRSPTVQARVAALSRLPDGRTLADALSPAVYQALEAYCTDTGFPVDQLATLRPSAAMLTLLAVALRELGITAPGVDEHFHRRARDDAKDVHALETVDEQIEYMLALEGSDPDRFVRQALEDLHDARDGGMQESLAAWRGADRDALVAQFIREQMLYSPETYRTLLVDRNRNWMPRIRQYLETPETELILVGVAHLVGDDGLLALLEREGYGVRRFAAP